MAVLKLLAWSERRTREPRKDASDLILILRSYLDAGHTEQLYKEVDRLLDARDFDYERAGSWLAGKDAVTLIRRHSANPARIEETVRSIVALEIVPEGPLRLIGELRETDVERARQLLTAFLAGFNGEHW